MHNLVINLLIVNKVQMILGILGPVWEDCNCPYSLFRCGVTLRADIDKIPFYDFR